MGEEEDEDEDGEPLGRWASTRSFSMPSLRKTKSFSASRISLFRFKLRRCDQNTPSVSQSTLSLPLAGYSSSARTPALTPRPSSFAVPTVRSIRKVDSPRGVDVMDYATKGGPSTAAATDSRRAWEIDSLRSVDSCNTSAYTMSQRSGRSHHRVLYLPHAFPFWMGRMTHRWRRTCT